MASMFEPDFPRDIYLEHMRRTLEWIEEKIRDHRRDPPHKGYNIEISVEAQWLQQLVAECVAKHQMLMEYQRVAYMVVQRDLMKPIVFPADAIAKGAPR